MKLRLQTDDHGLGLKIRNINRFIEDRDKAKVVMYCRGREIIRSEFGMKVYDRIMQRLSGKFQNEQYPRLDGNHVTMVVAPKS